MNQVLVWSIVALILIALVFYLVTVESDAELDPLRQEGGVRGLVKSFKNGLHRPPAPEPIDTDLTGFLAYNTEAGPAYVEADRVAARITHHTKTGYQLVRNTMDAMGGPRAESEIDENALALFPAAARLAAGANAAVQDIPSEPVRPLPGSDFRSKFRFPKRPLDADVSSEEFAEDSELLEDADDYVYVPPSDAALREETVVVLEDEPVVEIVEEPVVEYEESAEYPERLDDELVTAGVAEPGSDD